MKKLHGRGIHWLRVTIDYAMCNDTLFGLKSVKDEETDRESRERERRRMKTTNGEKFECGRRGVMDVQ